MKSLILYVKEVSYLDSFDSRNIFICCCCIISFSFIVLKCFLNDQALLSKILKVFSSLNVILVSSLLFSRALAR